MYYEEICSPYKKKRSLSTETSCDIKDINDNSIDNNTTDNNNSTDNNSTDNNDTDINNILNSINNLNINNNEELFRKFIKKIELLEKKFEIFHNLNIKIDKLEKNINNILIEKDYVIDNLKDNINSLNNEIKELKYKNYENIKNENNYFC